MRASGADDLNQGSASLAGRVACERNRGAIQPMEAMMSTKKMLMVIAALALGIAGAVSSAQAGSKDDDGAGVGGIKVGPLGQSFGAPPAEYSFGYAPLSTKQVRGKRERRD
jgi:hypothetical protein